MEWADAQQQALQRFLVGFTSPNPQVQADNLQQLDTLAQHPHALLAVCAVVCDGGSSSTVRLSATTVARQLLRWPERIAFYLKHPSGVEEDVQAVLETLLSRLLESSNSSTSPAFPAPLRRATASLIATLLKAAALNGACFAAATSVWCHLLSFLLQSTTDLASTSPSHGLLCTTSVDCGAQVAALLREVCEGALAAACPLQKWVGGQRDQCMALCNLFFRQVQLLRPSLCAAFFVCTPDSPPAPTLVAWTENLLAAFSACLESGVLPCAVPDFVSGADGAAEGGPASEALVAVFSEVLQIHASIQEATLHVVLSPLAHSADAGDGAAALASDPRRLLQTTAPFVAVSLRYMADTILIESFGALNAEFQRVALPALANFCDAAARDELVYDGAGEPDSIHAGVVACVEYVAQLVHMEHCVGETLPEGRSGGERTEITSYVACVHRLLVSAATLPTAVAAQLPEHTVQVHDSASEMLVTSATARRRRQRGARYSAAPATSPPGTVGDDDDVDAAEDDANGPAMTDLIEAQLPDNGTLRQAVAWGANSLTCKPEWMAALLRLVVVTPALPPAATPLDVCNVEAALFVCNETVDALLTDESVARATVNLAERLASQLSGVVSLLSNSPSSFAAPSFLRVQAVRFVGRLASGVMELWTTLLRHGKGHGDDVAQWLAVRTHTTLAPAGGLEGTLWLLSRSLTDEVNKAVQVECIRAMATLIAGFLRTLDGLSAAAERNTTAGHSDLEEESLGDDSSGESTASDDATPFVTQSRGGDAASMHAHLFCQSLNLSSGLLVLPQAVQPVLHIFSHLQWSVRQAVYHLLSETLPLLWSSAHQRMEHVWGAEEHTAAAAVAGTHALVRSVTVQALEVLAAHYACLLANVEASLFEMAALLFCMADVATAMDADALEAVVPWIIGVAHHVLNLYADHLAQHGSGAANSSTAGRGHATPTAAVVDMTDMCMVSLDLISCVCDGLVDRDALLSCQLSPQKRDEAAAMDARLSALASALLHPFSGCGASSAVLPSTSDALPNRCMALLSLCQSLPDHPSRTVLSCVASREAGQSGDRAAVLDVRAADSFGEVRRACFAVLYDCVLLLSYSASLLRPSTALSSPANTQGGLPDALGRELVDLCLREVLPSDATVLGSLGCAESVQLLKAASTNNAAASDAWLCLGAVVSLWDQQSYQMHRRGLACGGAESGSGSDTERWRLPSGPTSLFALSSGTEQHTVPLRELLTGVVSSLLTLLADRKFVVESYLKLNMTSALSGLAVVLASRSPFSQASPPPITLRLQTLDALFAAASSAHLREYAADAASGNTTGLSEAAQVLWCLGRVWEEAVQSLPQNELCVLLAARGKDMAKTVGWLLRCVSVHTTPASLMERSFWWYLLRLWRSPAQILVQASQAGVFSVTVAQAAALRQVAALQGAP